MSAFKPRSDAGGAEKRIEICRLAETFRRLFRFGLIGTSYRPEVRTSRWRFQCSGVLEVSTRGLIQAHGKIEAREAGQTLREMIDSIVFDRPRAVPAVALYFQTEVNVVFFAGLHSQQQAFALFGFEIARVSVDAVFGINPVAMVFCKPLHAIGFTAFFIGCERQD